MEYIGKTIKVSTIKFLKKGFGKRLLSTSEFKMAYNIMHSCILL